MQTRGTIASEKAKGGKGKWDRNGQTRIYELPFAPLRYKSRISM